MNRSDRGRDHLMSDMPPAPADPTPEEQPNAGRRKVSSMQKLLIGLGVIVVVFLLIGLVTAVTRLGSNSTAARISPLPSGSTSASTARTAAAVHPVVAPTPPPSLITQPAAGTRGLLDTVSWWNRNHQTITPDECVRQGEQPVGTERAWELSGSGIACYDDTTVSAWSGHMINVGIYFPRRVDQQQALSIATSLLPPDNHQDGLYDGINNDVSAIPDGTCQEAMYGSPALGVAVHQVNPTWDADPTKVTVTLYSGHATSADGSDTPYNPSSINLALIGIGPADIGSTGTVIC